MEIKLYFCDFDNVGDALNRYIYKKCFDIDVAYADSWRADYAGIGSILDHLLFQTKDIFRFFKNISYINKPVILMSCGFARESEFYFHKVRFFKKMKFKRKIQVLSLRGKLSAEQIATIDKRIDLSNIVLGDMGLLASYLLENREDKIYDLGICPHYADAGDPVFQKIHNENPNSVILNTMENPIDFVKKISQCRAVISTGLHPLIIADSLGIPNLWCRISEKSTTRYKYYDYYSVFSVKPQPVNLFKEEISSEKVIGNYQIDPLKVESVKLSLYEHHKKFFDLLKNGEGKI